MYTCGPTVYDYAHIGNFRAYLFEDLLRRYLQYRGYRVTQVMNLTDVEDKIIRRSLEQGKTIFEYTEPVIRAFFEDLDTLNIERAEHYPRATEHIDEMLQIIDVLKDKGHTYEKEGSVYYRIQTFDQYGRLSGVRPDEVKVGARVDAMNMRRMMPGISFSGKRGRIRSITGKAVMEPGVPAGTSNVPRWL